MTQSIANRKGGDSPQRSLIEVGAYGGVKKSHEKTAIRPGAAFPSVGTLRSTSGRIIDLAEKEREQHVVLFFYPADLEGLRYPEIAGCTPEACMFRDNVSVLRDLGATVYGVNLHPSERQKSFVAREHLNFELLSDFERKLVDALGVPTWSTEHGEIFVVRTTVIVRKGGEISEVFDDVDVKGHIDAVVDAVRRLGSRRAESKAASREEPSCYRKNLATRFSF